MDIARRRLTDLVPADYNPRKDLKPGDPEYEKLRRSIEEFGYVEPIIVNDATGHVVGGHQRIKVLRELGLDEVECVIVSLTPEREKALNIALNRISGEWDREKLALLITELQGSDLDVGLTGFDAGELEDLFRDRVEDGVHDDGYDPDGELRRPAMTRPGDVWTLGEHRLICGDSTLAETCDHLMAGAKADLVVTDPPYNVDYEGKAGRIRNDSMKDADFLAFLTVAFGNMAQAMKEGASIYVFHADTEGLAFHTAFRQAGFHLSNCCIWKKDSLVLGRSPYQWIHEPILFGWKEGARHSWYAGRKETTVWEYPRPQRSGEHPTMKPVELVAHPIMNSSKAGDIVLDPFGGSGSTLVACEQTGRVCRMAELDVKYADVIVERFIALMGGTEGVMLERDGLTYTHDEARAMMEDGDGR